MRYAFIITVADIKKSRLYITEGAHVKYLFVVNIDKVESEKYHMSHPQLINQIVSDLALSKFDATPSTTSALTTNILGKYQDVEKLYQRFHYHSFVVKLCRSASCNGKYVMATVWLP